MPTPSSFNQFTFTVRRITQEVETKVRELVEFTTSEIELEAIRKAPGPGERIKLIGGKSLSQETIRKDRNWVPISQAIGSKTENGGYTGIIFVENSAGELAAYVEFGTGQDASSYLTGLPKEWQDTARRFYIDGKGRIIHQPYFYPTLVKFEVQFIKELKEILKRAI